MKKRILVVCPYPEGAVPGQRLKYEQYFEHLRSKGYQITVSPFFERSICNVLYEPGRYPQKVLGTLWGYIKRSLQLAQLPFYDGIYVFLYVTPFGGPFFEWLFRLLSRQMIYDIDDLVFLGKTTQYNQIVQWLRGPEKYFYQMRVADHVITCTPYLDSFVRKHNQRTTDISSTINTKTYRPIENYANDHQLVLGWTGSHSTVPYLRLLEHVLQGLREWHDFKLLVIGTAEFRIDGIEVEAFPFDRESEVRDLRRIDIGLYPLPDEEWVLGKSGCKALQYMAMGIPAIATAVGANFRVIENGISGFLVKSDDEWRLRLAELMGDPELRRRIGQAGRERVERYYSVRANEPTYLSIFEQVYGSGER